MIPKPDIPKDIALNYKLVKVQWTEQLVSIQQQKTERIRKETEKIKVVVFYLNLILNDLIKGGAGCRKGTRSVTNQFVKANIAERRGKYSDCNPKQYNKVCYGCNSPPKVWLGPSQKMTQMWSPIDCKRRQKLMQLFLRISTISNIAICKFSCCRYIKLQVARSLINNTKLYFSGENSVVGGLINKILN